MIHLMPNVLIKAVSFNELRGSLQALNEGEDCLAYQHEGGTSLMVPPTYLVLLNLQSAWACLQAHLSF